MRRILTLLTILLFAVAGVAQVRVHTCASVCAIPTFSPAAGTYTSTQSVTLACTTPSSTIYYTTDGTTPTHSSSTYSTAISVSATTTINAICAATDYLDSPMASGVFTISSGTYTDDFNRSNGALGANWTTLTTTNAPTIASNTVTNSVDQLAIGIYTAAGMTSADQYSQVAVSATSASSTYPGVVARAANNTSSLTYYGAFIFGGLGTGKTAWIVASKAGTYTTLANVDTPGAVTSTWNAGDVIKLAVSGSATTTLTVYKCDSAGNNCVAQNTITDSSSPITAAGYAGVFVEDDGAYGVTLVDNWKAGAQ